jgi:hypothetical protein
MDKKPEEINTPVPDRVFAPVDGAETQTIVLFGAGKMMEHYLKKYGTLSPPAFVVDNDKTFGIPKAGVFNKKSGGC